jgi:hypothetical protein
MKCIPACPRKNVSPAIAGEDVRPVVAGLAAAAAMTAVYIGGDAVSSAVGGFAAALPAQTPEMPAGGPGGLADTCGPGSRLTGSKYTI